MWLTIWFHLSVSVGFATPLSTETLRTVVEQSKAFAVALDDTLGEGDGCFDSGSRYEPTTVNCQIWLQWVLAQAYAGGDETQYRRNMDALRYYEHETISFAQRKHFVDRWVLYSPEPLQRLEMSACQMDQSEVVTLRLTQFRSRHSYSRPLFEESAQGTEQHVVPYLSVEQAEQCLQALPVGWYVGFFVANDVWLSKWSTIGELGLVHAMMIEKTDTATLVHHASMDAKQVITEPWNTFHSRLSVVSKGYRFFSLNPTWHVDVDMPQAPLGCQ